MSRRGSGRRGGSATLPELDLVYAAWRDQVAHQRRHATGRFVVAERLAEERQALGRCHRSAFDFSLNRTVRVPADGYLRYAGCFYRAPVELVHQRVELHASRDRVWICWRGQRVARIRALLSPGDVAARAADATRAATPARDRRRSAAAAIDAPELADYAELCA